MFPQTLSLFGVRLLSVGSALWLAALCLVIVWTRSRAVRLYGMRRELVESALLWAILGAFVGAGLGAFIDRLPRFFAGAGMPALFGSGFSSGAGYFAAAAAVIVRFRKDLREAALAFESMSVPTAFMIAIGRLGCLANGCCRGLPTDLPIGIHFPNLPPEVGFFPYQPLESAFAALLGAALWAVEKKFGTCVERKTGAFLMPLLIVCYGTWRVLSGFFRAGGRTFGLIGPQYWWIVWTLVGAVWLARTLRGRSSA